MTEENNLIKVSSKSSPNSVAGAIIALFNKHGTVDVQVIGAGAVNQAIKAIAIARGFTPSEIELILTPCFTDVLINGEERTAIKLIVEDRRRAGVAR